jgi:hypothetical protein
MAVVAVPKLAANLDTESDTNVGGSHTDLSERRQRREARPEQERRTEANGDAPREASLKTADGSV